VGEHREGVMIAPLRSLHETSLVHPGPLFRRSHPAALTEYVARLSRIVPGQPNNLDDRRVA
jgi:hypothetical protein